MRLFAIVVLVSAVAVAQNAPPRSDDAENRRSTQSQRDPSESSSKDTRVDISPPPNDAKHDGSDVDDEAEAETTGVREVKKWNPHKAAKAIEVGDFYFRYKNYKAAISRYREALEYKEKDAEATYKLALALERSKQLPESASHYRDYLKIMPNGVHVPDVNKALARIGPQLPNQEVPLAPIDQAMKDGESELAGKDFRRAIAEFAKAIELDPQHALAHYKLAQALEGSGDANAALASYYRYLQVAPGGQYSVDAAASVDRLKKQGATISQSVQTRP